MSNYAANTNAKKPKPTCHHCKKPGKYGNQCPLLNKKEQVKSTPTDPGDKNSGVKNFITNNNNNNNKNNKNNNRAERKLKNVYPRCEICGQKELPQREMLCSSQCSKKATSLKEQTGKTEWTSSTGRTEQHNWLCPGHSTIT